MNFDALNNQSRLLIQARLQPVQGSRFQPTGFPGLGAAEFETFAKQRMLLVESEQSIANHLERTLFKEFTRDTVSADLNPSVLGIPYVDISLGELGKTNTLLEAHRLNTPYLWESSDESAVNFQSVLLKELGLSNKRKKKGEQNNESEESDDIEGVIDMNRFYRTLLKYDTNSLLHGIFLEKDAGRLRLPRAISGFIEASNVSSVYSGGVKNDHVFPAKDSSNGITSNDGYTNVPYQKVEYIAETIEAAFCIDLALIRGFGFSHNVTALLISLAIYKIQRFLKEGLRLRSNCILEVVGDLTVVRPIDFSLPSLSDLNTALPNLIKLVAVEGVFADPPVTKVIWAKGKKKITINLPATAQEPAIPDSIKKEVAWRKKTKKAGPFLEVKTSLTSELIEQLCALFPNDPESQKAIRMNMDQGDAEKNEVEG